MKGKVNVILPKTAETMEEGTIIQWLKQEGEKVEKGEILVEVETEKAVVNVESSHDGILSKILVENGSIVPAFTEIALIETEVETILDNPVINQGHALDETISSTQIEVSQPAVTEMINHENQRIKASPLAKKLAKEFGINLSEIQGSGPGGRIAREDILAVVEKNKSDKSKEKLLESPTIQMTPVRKTIAKRLKESKERSPHFYMTMTVDMTELVVWRNSQGKELEKKENIHITFNDLIVTAVSRSLAIFSLINVSCENDTIILHPEINIGIAVDAEEGLIVPVIRNTDHKSLPEISKRISLLTQKAKEKKLSKEDISGGTFTVSNLGMYGVDQFTAIINPPESAILAIGGINKEPVIVNNGISIRDRMKITLSSDHRVVDGVLAARFLQKLKSFLQQPSSFLG